VAHEGGVACVGGWLRVGMAGSRKWTVESKEFELLIKGGRLGQEFLKEMARDKGPCFC
jgi:hypothetical protein